MKYLKSEIEYIKENFDQIDIEINKLFDDIKQNFTNDTTLINNKLIDLLYSINDDSSYKINIDKIKIDKIKNKIKNIKDIDNLMKVYTYIKNIKARKISIDNLINFLK